MEGSRIGLLVTRVLQLIFAAIVLGVAAQYAVDISDARDICNLYGGSDKSTCKDNANYYFNKPQPSIEYAAFTGAWGILAALITLAAVFLDAIPSIAAFALDGLAAVFYLAGGINNAVQRSNDPLFTVGDYFKNINTRWDTVTAFMFLGFIASLAGLVLVFLSRRSGGLRHSAV